MSKRAWIAVLVVIAVLAVLVTWSRTRGTPDLRNAARIEQLVADDEPGERRRGDFFE